MEETLKLLDNVTTSLGDALRIFKTDTCARFNTRELPREVTSRTKKEVKKPTSREPQDKYAKRPKAFNLNTYKLHSLGDYTNAIRNYGTTDSYSTQIVSVLTMIAELPVDASPQGELSHRDPKMSFQWTSKKEFERQLAMIERRKVRLRCIREISSNAMLQMAGVNQNDVLEPIHATAVDHYEVGESQNDPIDLFPFLQRNSEDPAVRVRRSRLVIT